jgi:hypothetical protein
MAPASFFADAEISPVPTPGITAAGIIGAHMTDRGLYLDVMFDGVSPDLAKRASRAGYDLSWVHSDTRNERTDAVELLDSEGRPVPLLRGKPVTGFFIAPPYIGPPPQRALTPLPDHSRVVQQFVFRVDGPVSVGTCRVRLTDTFRTDEASLVVDHDWYVFQP